MPTPCILTSMLSFWKDATVFEIDNQEGFPESEFCMRTNHCCLMTLPSGVIYPPNVLSKITPGLGGFHLKTYSAQLVCHLDHCFCFMTLPPGAAHSPKTTELRHTAHNIICYELMQWNCSVLFDRLCSCQRSGRKAAFIRDSRNHLQHCTVP